MVHRFKAQGIIGEMDCVYSSWATDRAEGFGDGGVADLERLVPLLALAVKSASLTRIARTLVETYLGRDPGRRVLAGGIMRGVADRIESVLWFSDLSGYTRISDTSPPEQVIPLLNDYADAIGAGGHVETRDCFAPRGRELAVGGGCRRHECRCRHDLEHRRCARIQRKFLSDIDTGFDGELGMARRSIIEVFPAESFRRSKATVRSYFSRA